MSVSVSPPPAVADVLPAAPHPDTTPGAAPRRRLRTAARHPIGFWVAVAVLAVIALAALRPEWLATQDPLAIDTTGALQPPAAAHWFGTDENGRDLYSRVVHGARHAFFLGLGAVAIGLAGGIAIGIFAGLGNRRVDQALMRLTDVGLAFPELLLALVVISLFGGGLRNTVLAIGLASIPTYARLIRTQTLAVRRSSYVEAAVALGLSPAAVVWRHVLPNATKPLLVLATIGVGTASVAGAALSFLGLGTAPPTPEWGLLLATSRDYLAIAWWYGVIPGLVITALVMCTTTIGRGLSARAEGRLR
ncbi:binding-protein-dependent transport systems inner membrane component [Beutenbergia cavernae DSM 12333]|uniref:Binding-protein-dependent transport systems inner membrane component n=1 Tax=Beutenbergia cavernae (strain ATCC BAA-8 / DSM 12333 / CCUG 43141 / JCM 11478 / NBRC 16432 / NCIMB 13614 / HKI 0122) TaxID=471853 RepID=C5C4S3_BEUC1|nr:ABC transporter permease [Beutenbergia cavernae]ACQ80051.1 binding-protein-dependent transport systems inner membrane component [Beutenbergia cavernae DSM 12333]